MKSVIFVKSYFSVIPANTEVDVTDTDFIAWQATGHVEEIPYVPGRGIWMKSVADLQVRSKDSHNYIKAKARYADTFKDGDKKDKIDERCDIVSTYLVDEYSIKTIRDANGQEFWYRLDGVYMPNGQTIILEVAYEFFGKSLGSAIINKIELLTRAKTLIEPSNFFNQVDKRRIGVANGILNLETFELEDPRTVKTNIFVRIPVVFDKTQTCPHFESFLSDILEKPEHVTAIQQILGFSMLPEYKYEKIFIWTGTGRNGKSKLISIFKSFLGAHNCTAHSLQTLQTKEYCLAEMHNKLANIGGDISSDALRSTDIIKQATGQDLISGNRKYKDYIQFVNYAKQIFACNELPTIYDGSQGFWNRINRLQFPYTFYEQKEYDNLPTDKRAYAKIRKEDILDNILTPSEMSGILNYAIKGLQSLYAKSSFANSIDTEVTRSNWLRNTSSFYAFVSDLFEFYPSCYICSEHINALYDVYCEHHNLQQVAPNQRISHIREFSGKTIIATSKKCNDETIRCIKGIKLKKHIEDHILELVNKNGTITTEIFNQVTPVTAVTAVLHKIDFENFQNSLPESGVTGETAVTLSKISLNHLVTAGLLVEVKPGVYQTP